MRTTLGRKGDYAVRAMLDVARHWDIGRRKTRLIAETMDIPLNYLTQILSDLVAQGLLVARAGPAGGYTLARPPAEISLLDVVAASGAAISLDTCVLQGGPCDWVESCPIHDTWAAAQAAFAERLDATSLADLAVIDAAIEAGTHRPAEPLHPERKERHGVRS